MRPTIESVARVFTVLAVALLTTEAGAAPKWEEIPAAELTATAGRIDPQADAEAIFVRTWIEDRSAPKGFEQVQRHHVRIKVYTAAGAEKQGKVRIDLPLKGSSVGDIEARTVHPDGTTAEFDRKSVHEEVVYKQHREGVRRFSFAVPGVTPGSVLEYRYRTTVHNRIAQYQILRFQSDIPRRSVS